MSETVAACEVRVRNPEGMHARPANQFVQVANRFQSTVEIIKGDDRVDGKSILGILTLAAEEGTELKIEARGPDAESAVQSLFDLVEQGFVEDQQIKQD